MKNTINFKREKENKNQSHSQSQVGHSFGDFRRAIGEIKEQIEIQNFKNSDRVLAEDIAMMIAEVSFLPKDAEIQIAGNKMTSAFVSEVYKNLEYDHIATVIKNFKAANYEIKHIKTYLRTALYNSVFELEAHITNDISSES